MSAFATYSTTASANVTFHSLDIGEGCPAENMNDALRYVLAEGRELYDLVAAISTSTLMPKAGGAFTGSITRSSAGSYTYWASSSLPGGAMYVQSSSTSLPSSPAEGTIVYQY